ncbi:DUF4058 family protein [Fimbriiglobus ruber]|uniref:DUF4058 domain-containing protein n=1 Tax=Fimbriiglobus ruber TaxID=1908690 RepID=A0A225DK81_9BACT|nr:DUF4058 family protein [Fimbriiglobus ruber]OWK36567.1 hypothetical protein FRUB_09130 [Fimbriiglobus ruber]
MPSPFPGMDPWLERPMVFPSLHNSLLIYLQAALTAALPRGYFAASANRVWVDVAARREPDVSVFGPDDVNARGAGSVATALTRAGLLEAAADELSDPIEEPYLEIRSDEGDRLVTAVEVLSQSNKRAGDNGRTSYQQKQGEYRASGVNLVEIDLLRTGPHTTAVPEAQLRAVAGRFDYHVCVMVAGSPNRYFVSPIRLESCLPTIPIPLDPDVPPVSVDVQAVFSRAYDEGGFAHLARYDRRTPEPPLSDEQRAWAEGVLRAKGLMA